MPEQNNNTSGNRRRRQQPVDNSYAHVQPQATEIERAVLGALMIDKDAYAVVCEMLLPESFYEPRNQKVYRAIMELSLHESPVDVWTVTEQLAKQGDLEDIGGPGYVTELSSRVASSANIEYHARIIAQKSLARQLIQFSSKIQTMAFDETVDVDDLMQEAEGSLFELGQRNMKKDYTQIDPVIKNAIDVIQKAAANKDGLTGVPTGYHKLDDITSGWQPSDLVIIAGRPAMGKTSFALSMAKNIAADYKVPMAFFSLEMSNVQLVNRLISNVCEIQGSKILNGQLQRDEWDRLDKRVNTLLDAPIYVAPASADVWARRELFMVDERLGVQLRGNLVGHQHGGKVTFVALLVEQRMVRYAQRPYMGQRRADRRPCNVGEARVSSAGGGPGTLRRRIRQLLLQHEHDQGPFGRRLPVRSARVHEPTDGGRAIGGAELPDAEVVRRVRSYKGDRAGSLRAHPDAYP